jgi:hypothetical protein
MRYNSNILSFDGSNKIIHARIEIIKLQQYTHNGNLVGTMIMQSSTCISRIILIDHYYKWMDYKLIKKRKNKDKWAILNTT